MRIIITEKPQTNHWLAKAAADAHPGEEIFFIETLPFWLNNFKFPKGMSMRDYPFFTPPAYKRDQPWGDLSRKLSKVENGQAVRVRIVNLDEAREVMLRANEIICACDWDATGAWGFDLFIEQTLGNDKASSYPVIVLAGGLDEQSATRSIRSMITTDHPSYRAMLDAGRVKRLFDYNYALNSLAILGNLYRTLASNRKPLFVSKYALQILIWISKNPSMPVWKIEHLMAHHWVGTGKYSKNSTQHLQGLGGAASRKRILEDLVENDFVHQAESGMMSITEFGRAFVNSLHPDCCDEDLPFRLDAWMSQGVEASEPAMKRYINTFFGKQARHQAIITAPKM